MYRREKKKEQQSEVRRQDFLELAIYCPNL